MPRRCPGWPDVDARKPGHLAMPGPAYVTVADLLNPIGRGKEGIEGILIPDPWADHFVGVPLGFHSLMLGSLVREP